MSSRRLRPDELRLWGAVAATVRPSPGRAAPVVIAAETASTPAPPPAKAKSVKPPAPVAKAIPKPRAPQPPGDIEPRRKHRISRERDPLEARLDLHGLDQDRARVVLETFLRRAQAEGHRAALVITGKGLLGDGVLRRRFPEWLAQPGLRELVAGSSHAHPRHGGEGAFYVALKRKS